MHVHTFSRQCKANEIKEAAKQMQKRQTRLAETDIQRKRKTGKKGSAKLADMQTHTHISHAPLFLTHLLWRNKDMATNT